MHLTAPSHWSRSIGTGGRDRSEQVDAIVGMRSAISFGGCGLLVRRLTPALCHLLGICDLHIRRHAAKLYGT